MSLATLSYAIDEQDRLIRLDEGFYRFAEENGWHGAHTSVGRSLWDFVAGEEVRRVQRLLLRRIRDDVDEVELAFRCDGPDVTRELNLRIAATASGRGVLFTTRLRSEEEREEPQPLLDPERQLGPDSLPMCAWCDRFEVDGEWVEVEEAARRLELFRRPELPAIDHTVCPRDTRLLERA